MATQKLETIREHPENRHNKTIKTKSTRTLLIKPEQSSKQQYSVRVVIDASLSIGSNGHTKTRLRKKGEAKGIFRPFREKIIAERCCASVTSGKVAMRKY